MHVAITNDGSSRADGLGIFIDGQKIDTEVVRDSLTKNITGGGGDTFALVNECVTVDSKVAPLIG